MSGVRNSLGLIGVVLLFFGIAARALLGTFNAYSSLHVVVGLCALVTWAYTSRGRLRTFFGERSTKYGANAFVYSGLGIGLLVLANYLGTRYHFEIDTTEAQVYSLSPQSRRVVDGVPENGRLELLAFVQGGSHPHLEGLLENYAGRSPVVEWNVVDPERHPEIAERYNITQMDVVRVAWTPIGEGGEDGFSNSVVVKDPGEGTITNAIIKVTGEEQKLLCFVEGHGEPDPEDFEGGRGLGRFRQALVDENYATRQILLASMPSVPDECHVLVVAAPERPWFESERKALDEWLSTRGRAVFLLSARRPEAFAEVLSRRGITVRDDVVVDQVVRLFQGPALGLEPIVETYEPHPITEEFAQRTLFPFARTVEPDSDAPEGATTLARTGPQSWAETDLQAVFESGEVGMDPERDRRGPVSIAAAVSADLENDEEARIVVFGGGEFVENRALSTFYNQDLALNAVGWAAGEENLLSIRPRGIRASRVELTQNEIQGIFYLSVLLLPEILLFIGIAVWAARRNA